MSITEVGGHITAHIGANCPGSSGSINPGSLTKFFCLSWKQERILDKICVLAFLSSIFFLHNTSFRSRIGV